MLLMWAFMDALFFRGLTKEPNNQFEQIQKSPAHINRKGIMFRHDSIIICTHKNSLDVKALFLEGGGDFFLGKEDCSLFLKNADTLGL